MTETPREHLIDWLRDAYAMEMQAENILEKMVSRLKAYPVLEARVSQHLVETRAQAEKVKGCLHQIDADTSAIKTGIASLMGTTQALSGALASDEIIKHAAFSLSFSHFEIATYVTVIAAAEVAGETSIKSTLESILTEEEAMAAWLREHLPGIVKQYLLTG